MNEILQFNFSKSILTEEIKKNVALTMQEQQQVVSI